MENNAVFSNVVKRLMAEDAVELLVSEAHSNAVAHGFYEGIEEVIAFLPPDLKDSARYDFILAQIAKIGSELGEAVSVIQDTGAGDHDLLEELADVVIRVFDLVGFLPIGQDFPKALLTKMERNRSRPYLHNKRC